MLNNINHYFQNDKLKVIHNDDYFIISTNNKLILEQKNKEIAELQDKVHRLEELVFEMYDSWIKHNCCGRHD